MKKKISNFAAKAIGRTICKEVNSACVIIGYQTAMPESAKSFRDRKKKK